MSAKQRDVSPRSGPQRSGDTRSGGRACEPLDIYQSKFRDRSCRNIPPSFCVGGRVSGSGSASEIPSSSKTPWALTSGLSSDLPAIMWKWNR